MSTSSNTKKVRLTRVEQNAERSRELLASAWAVFCEKGYEAVTIDDVAAHAGYSRMPIYSLFGDKLLKQHAIVGIFAPIAQYTVITPRVIGMRARYDF